MSEEIEKKLNFIIEAALQGRINLEEFYIRWPSEELDGIEYYDQMYAEIENAIEHTPFDLFSKKINDKIWKKTREYKTLLFYKSIIKS